MESQVKVQDKGGTMRLGAYACALKPGTLAHRLYGKDEIQRAPPPPLRGEQRLPRPAAGGRAW